jgi:hypothetical protein
MPDVFDIDPMSKYMAFYVGPNGCGKSIAIASWKEVGPVYTFDFDGRMNSVVNWYKDKGLKKGELIYDTYGPSNLYDAYTKLKDLVEVHCPYSAVSLDSFTAATITAVTYSIYKRMGKGPNSKDYPKLSKGEMLLPDWDEWNAEAMFVTIMLDLCKQLAARGIAIFWTGHPVQRMNIKQEGNTQKISYQTKFAAFGHKSDSLIPIYFNEIYHFRPEIDIMTNTVMRKCHTQPAEDVVAKTALNLPKVIDWTNRNFRETFLSCLGKKEQPIEVKTITI